MAVYSTHYKTSIGITQWYAYYGIKFKSNNNSSRQKDDCEWKTKSFKNIDPSKLYIYNSGIKRQKVVDRGPFYSHIACLATRSSRIVPSIILNFTSGSQSYVCLVGVTIVLLQIWKCQDQSPGGYPKIAIVYLALWRCSHSRNLNSPS